MKKKMLTMCSTTIVLRCLEFSCKLYISGAWNRLVMTTVFKQVIWSIGKPPLILELQLIDTSLAFDAKALTKLVESTD